MKLNRVLILATSCVLTISSAAQVITSEATQRAKEIVSKMTLREKIDYISGYTAFSILPIPRLGLPEVFMADGPQGIRCYSKFSTLYPCGMLTASTWNRDMAYQMGQGLGRDASARGISFLLGPGVNIYRSPLCGRNFEYFGEDPYLTGEIAKQYIEGVQSQGVIATIKHFATNNEEWDRYRVSSDVDERTLHEIYLPAFRKAVEEAHVGAVMNSYNLLNGVHTTENAWLDKHVLRDLWGFKGVLMSDWVSVHSTLGAVNNGIDIEMPSGKFLNYDSIKPLIDRGLINEKNIDRKVQNILQTLIAFGDLNKQKKVNKKEHFDKKSDEAALNIAREGIVLLKNDQSVLPLKGKTVLTGPNADLLVCGGGSGEVTPLDTVTLRQTLSKMCKLGRKVNCYDDITSSLYADSVGSKRGFTARYFSNMELAGAPTVTTTENCIWHDWGMGKAQPELPADHFSASWTSYYTAADDGELQINLGADDGYRVFINGKLMMGDWSCHGYNEKSCLFDVKAGKKYQLRIEYYDNDQGASVKFRLTRFNEKKLNDMVKDVDNVVYCAGYSKATEGEGFDRTFTLPSDQNSVISHLVAKKKNVIVVINSGGGVDMSSWIDGVKAVVMAWYPGQEGNRALAEILTGKVNPSGKLAFSMERKLEDNPCYHSYYNNMSERECQTVQYSEGIFMGYRGYDRNGVKPLFSFGYGLSYTQFQYSDLNVLKDGDNVIVSFKIKNTGSVAGKEVAQVYVHDVKCCVPRPLKELKGFEKVSLKSGETKTVTVTLPRDAFSYYDISTEKFVVEPGDFDIWVGASSDNILLKQQISM